MRFRLFASGIGVVLLAFAPSMHAAITVNSVNYQTSGNDVGFYRTLNNSAGFLVDVPFSITRTGSPNFTDEILTAAPTELIHPIDPFNPVRLDWGSSSRAQYSLTSSPLALDANIFGQKAAVHIESLSLNMTIDVTISGSPVELIYNTGGAVDIPYTDHYFLGDLRVNNVVVESWVSYLHPGESSLSPSYTATLSPGNYVLELQSSQGNQGYISHSRLQLTAIPEASTVLLIGIASTIAIGWVARHTKK